MRILGREISLQISRVASAEKALAPSPTQPLSNSMGGWASSFWGVIREPFTGAWQSNMELRTEAITSYHAVYACITLIAQDIAKVRMRLVELENGIWSETFSPAFSPVLAKPNRYQNRIKFFEQWLVSKLIHGNTYVLLERDNRGVVVSMYILDPCRTTPLVAPNGEVYYRVTKDNLTGVEGDNVVVPASEVIHDVMVPLFHPLCGVSPLTACGLAASQGLAIQTNSARFFANGSRPGGILTAPGLISQEVASRLKEDWQSNFTGPRAGNVAVLGDGLKYETMAMNAVDSQLIEQLQWSSETICSCFHVPPYMIGVGTMPTYSNIEALNQQYYTQCLQALIENIELLLDDGLGLTTNGTNYGTEFDLEDLLRMDTAAKVKAAADAIGAGFMTPNEARAKFDLGPVAGGNSPYMQQQNFSLEALAKRDAKSDPFAKVKLPGATPAADTPPAKMLGHNGGPEIDEPDIQPEVVSYLAAMAMRDRLGMQPHV